MEDYKEFKEQEFDLRGYVQVIRKRKWTIIAVFMIVFLLAAVHTFRATPVYKAAARIVLEKENPNIVSVQEVLAMDASSSDYFQTQYKIIESQAVAREVALRLNLESSREFFPEPRGDMISVARRWVRDSIEDLQVQVAELINTGREKDAHALSALEVREADALLEDVPQSLVRAVIGRIEVAPVRNSRLVDVGAEARDPKMAAKIANTVVRAYIDQNLEIKLRAAKDAVQWLTARIDEERKKVEAAENALLQYKQENEIITDFSSDTESITAEKLAGLNAQVIEAESKRVEAETRYQQALQLVQTPEFLDAIPEVMGNELVQEIKRMEVDLLNQATELSKKYGQNHPRMIALQSELEQLQKRKATEAEGIVNALRNNYKLALARERTLKRAMNQQKSESLDMNKKAIQFGVLQRQAESSRQMYELLIKRFKETSLTEEMKTGNVRIIDEAMPPQFPIRPDKRRNLMLALALGLMLGLGLAFLLEYLDNTIKIPDEIGTHLDIPYLGPVPAFDTSEKSGDLPGELITAISPTAIPSESFRGIRTSILFSSPDKAPQVIMVSSAEPGEGKTFFAANLAVTMAQNDAKVLLIDGDLRRPRIHNLFRIDREPGLTGMIVGTRTLEETLHPSVVENLDLMTVGHIPPNPSELMGSSRLRALLETLRSQYDRIIIDTPPVLSVTDAAALSSAVDGVVLVIRTAVTPSPLLKNAVERLRSVNANILGAVLNAVNTKKEGYYYHYHYYYYGYGEIDKKGRARQKKHQAA